MRARSAECEIRNGKTILEVADPKFAFAKAAAWLLPRAMPKSSIHSTAIVSPTAKIAENVSIAPYAVIEEEAEIGAGTTIGAHAFIGRASRIGADCILHPRVTLYAGAWLGDRVEVHSGAVIGSDGFGYVFGEGRYWKFPQARPNRNCRRRGNRREHHNRSRLARNHADRRRSENR